MEILGGPRRLLGPGRHRALPWRKADLTPSRAGFGFGWLWLALSAFGRLWLSLTRILGLALGWIWLCLDFGWTWLHSGLV